MFDIETIKRDKEFKFLVKGILQDRRRKNIAKYGKRNERRKKIRENH